MKDEKLAVETRVIESRHLRLLDLSTEFLLHPSLFIRQRTVSHEGIKRGSVGNFHAVEAIYKGIGIMHPQDVHDSAKAFVFNLYY